MSIDLTCVKCDSSFELDPTELLNGSDRIQCPHCNSKVSPLAVEEFAISLAEFCKQIAALSKRFSLSLSLESDDLPSTYRLDEEEEEEEAEEEEEEDVFEDMNDGDEAYESEENY
ncbi:MAG: hypothetical protein LBM75_07975 [Myxococcales bacterium]|jgi:hypothetical protein|nr:hypothetical protein [Myxococcales bacterium]